MPHPPLPTVTLVQAARHAAGRHGLLPDSPPASLTEAVVAVLALHATEPATAYLSLWARLPGFTPAALDAALYDQRVLVRTAAMRATVHIVAADDLPYFHHACAPVRRQLDDSARRYIIARMGLGDDAAAYIDDLQCQVVSQLGSSGPATAAELARAIPALKSPIPYTVGRYVGSFTIASRLVPAMCTSGLLVRARVRGTWRSSQCEYDLLARWLPGTDLNSTQPRQAVAWLVRRYLRQFGPVTVRDAAWWTGLPARDIAGALSDLGGEVAAVSLQDQTEPHMILASDLPALLALPGEPPAAAWLLPSLDPLIMGYAGRSRFLSPEDVAKVFDRAGNALPTAWVGGRVVGLWSQDASGRVKCHPFVPLEHDALDSLENRAAALTNFLGGTVIPYRTHSPFSRTVVASATRTRHDATE